MSPPHAADRGIQTVEVQFAGSTPMQGQPIPACPCCRGTSENRTPAIVAVTKAPQTPLLCLVAIRPPQDFDLRAMR